MSVHDIQEHEDQPLIGQQPSRPPEALLMRRRREALSPPMSRRQAAAKAGISPSQWSDVERGIKKAGTGVTVPVQATARTLAKMAQAIGVTADELAAAGREDAARDLRDTADRTQLRQRLAAIPGLGALASDTSSGLSQPDELLSLVGRGLDAIEACKLPARTKHELASLFTGNLLHDATRRYDELILILRLAEANHPPG
jgi:transcriptional regulator with XRE-family HTH domain